MKPMTTPAISMACGLSFLASHTTMTEKMGCVEMRIALASAILISTHPIFSVIVVWLARKERPQAMEIAGVVMGFIGVAVFLRAWDAFAAAQPGDLFSLGAAAAFGTYGVVTQPLTRRFPPRELMAYGLALG